MNSRLLVAVVSFSLIPLSATSLAQAAPLVAVDRASAATDFPIAANGQATAIYVAPGNPETVRVAAEAFAADVERVTGVKPQMLTSLATPLPANLIVVGVLGKSPEIDKLVSARKLDASAVAGKWEAAVTAVVNIAAAGREAGAGDCRQRPSWRGVCAVPDFARDGRFAVDWWADVPVAHHAAIYIHAGAHVQPSPSVQYRGIFFNDEDWGLRPWAAKKMDPAVDNGKGNIGPNTYEKVFRAAAAAACELAVAGDASGVARVQRRAGEREARGQVGYRDGVVAL